VNAEPKLEDLSAYVDQELTGTARQELEAHLQTCETCRRRLDALRQTVSAVKAMPTEAPPRPFTIPPQRQQRKATTGWAWAGGALAAACLLIVVSIGFANLPHGGGTATTAARPATAQGGAADHFAAPGFNSTTVTDPQNPSRQLTLGTGMATTLSSDQSQKGTAASQAAPAPAYVPANGLLQVDLVLRGMPGDAVPTSLNDAHLRISLSRPGYEVFLTKPESFTATRESGAVRIAASYRLSSIGLPNPAAGDYTLRATWQGPDGSAVVLVAEVPVTITA
jgi:anti-sigma factor RsiW